MQEQFADIRPHTDLEVPAVLTQLVNSKTLQLALLRYRFPKCPKWLAAALQPWLHRRLKKQIQHIHNVEEFQRWLIRWVDSILARTITDIEVRGLEHLDPTKAYLWLSNHRDIAMDPMLINYSLHQARWPTGQIAIGDNLLKQPDIAALMRLNKSFIVKRDISNRREKLRELQRLSAYIRQTLLQGSSVWLAQREGRAKDGIDETDTAVLKMLALSGRELGEDFSTSIMALQPVPVCIQYEWDPCDVAKANELSILEKIGRYAKAADEDTRSILLGLMGFKGRILVSFGTPLTEQDVVSADAMAQAVDQQIHQMTRVLPVHRTALALLQQQFSAFTELPKVSIDAEAAKEFERRSVGLDEGVRRRLLQTYAQPLITLAEQAND